MAYYLSMDGVDDYLKTPSMTFNQIVLDMKSRAAAGRIYLDARSGHGTGYFQKTGGGPENWGASISSVKLDGVTKTNGTSFMPVNTRCTIEVNFAATAADDVNIFSSSTGASPVAGDLYSVKFYNGATLVAYYDMTLGNVQDQSGNGRHATLTGGTWVDEGGGGTAHTGDSSVTGVSTVTASGTVSTGHMGQASAIGVASVTASGSVLGPAQTGNAAVVGASSVVATGSIKLSGNVAVVGVSTVIASAAGMPIKGDASVFGVSWVTASALSGIMTIKKIRFLGERQTKLTFQGQRILKIQFAGERQTVIRLQGGLPVAKKEQNGEHTAGDSVDLEFIVTDSHTGLASNLTSGSGRWVLKQSVNSPALVSKTASVSGNTATVTLSPGDTQGIKAGRYYHEAEVTDSFGKVSTVTKGWITIEDSGV